MRANLKMLGAEVLYLLVSVIIAGLATLLQIVGRTYEGDHSSFIWSGSDYRYNPLFYMLKKEVRLFLATTHSVGWLYI